MCDNINIIGVLFIQPSMSTHMWARSVLACSTTHNTKGSIALYCSALLISQSMLLLQLMYFVCLIMLHVPWVSNLWSFKFNM